jgi:hypothetical protein
MVKLDRTKDAPWVLKTPPGTTEYTMHVAEKGGAKAVQQVREVIKSLHRQYMA